MNPHDDPRLFCVATKLKERQKALDDAEWEGASSDEVQVLMLEVEHLEYLHENGVVWGTNF